MEDVGGHDIHRVRTEETVAVCLEMHASLLHLHRGSEVSDDTAPDTSLKRLTGLPLT